MYLVSGYKKFCLMFPVHLPVARFSSPNIILIDGRDDLLN